MSPNSPLPAFSDEPSHKPSSPKVREKTWLNVCAGKWVTRLVPGLVSPSFGCHSMRRQFLPDVASFCVEASAGTWSKFKKGVFDCAFWRKKCLTYQCSFFALFAPSSSPADDHHPYLAVPCCSIQHPFFPSCNHIKKVEKSQFRANICCLSNFQGCLFD